MKFIKKEPIIIHFGLNFSSFKDIISEDRYRRFLSENSYEYLREKIKSLPYPLSVSLGHSPDYNFENKLIAISVKNYENVSLVYNVISKEMKILNDILLYLSKEKLEEISMIHNKEVFIRKMNEMEHIMKIEKDYNNLNKKVKATDRNNNKKVPKPKV